MNKNEQVDLEDVGITRMYSREVMTIINKVSLNKDFRPTGIIVKKSDKRGNTFEIFDQEDIPKENPLSKLEDATEEFLDAIKAKNNFYVCIACQRCGEVTCGGYQINSFDYRDQQWEIYLMGD